MPAVTSVSIRLTDEDLALIALLQQRLGGNAAQLLRRGILMQGEALGLAEPGTTEEYAYRPGREPRRRRNEKSEPPGWLPGGSTF
jgi:hypothetical protein